MWQYADQFLLVHKPHPVADHPRSGENWLICVDKEKANSEQKYSEDIMSSFWMDRGVAVPSRHQRRRPVVAWLRAIRRIRYNQSDHLCTCAPGALLFLTGPRKLNPSKRPCASQLVRRASPPPPVPATRLLRTSNRRN